MNLINVCLLLEQASLLHFPVRCVQISREHVDDNLQLWHFFEKIRAFSDNEMFVFQRVANCLLLLYLQRFYCRIPFTVGAIKRKGDNKPEPVCSTTRRRPWRCGFRDPEKCSQSEFASLANNHNLDTLCKRTYPRNIGVVIVTHINRHVVTRAEHNKMHRPNKNGYWMKLTEFLHRTCAPRSNNILGILDRRRSVSSTHIIWSGNIYFQ